MGSPIRLEFNCSECKADNTLHSGCTPRINEDRMDWIPFEVDYRFTFRCTECELPNLFQGTKESGFTPVPTQTNPAVVHAVLILGWRYGEPVQRLFGIYQDIEIAHASATTWIKRNPGKYADDEKNDDGENATFYIREMPLL